MIDQPIFIVGHPRSGSTLLASVLSRHPRLATMPETHFFDASYSGNFVRRWRTRNKVESLLTFALQKNVRLMDLGFQHEDVFVRLKHCTTPTPRDVLNIIFRLVIERSGANRVIEKTPRHIEYIDRIIDWYPKAQIICILRDGRDAIQSLMDVPWTHSNAERHAAYWRWCVMEARAKARKYPRNVILVRYEDLVQEAQRTLAYLCGFLGEEFSEMLLADVSTGDAVPEWESDWKRSSMAMINPDAAFKWQKSKTENHKHWERWMTQELSLLNYPVTERSAANNILYDRRVFSLGYWFVRFVRTHVAERRNQHRKMS